MTAPAIDVIPAVRSKADPKSRGGWGKHEQELLAAQAWQLDQELAARKILLRETGEVVALFNHVRPMLERLDPIFDQFAAQIDAAARQLDDMRSEEKTAGVPPDVLARIESGPEKALLIRNAERAFANHAYFGLFDLYHVLIRNVFNLLGKVSTNERILAPRLQPVLKKLQQSWNTMRRLQGPLSARRVARLAPTTSDTAIKAAFDVWGELLKRNPDHSYLHSLCPHEGKPGPRRIVYFSIGGLGDALLQTAVVAEIKRRFAPCEITFVHGRPCVAGLFRGNPTVAAAIYAQDGLLLRLIEATKILGIFDLVFESRFVVWAENCHGSRITAEQDIEWIAATQRHATAFAPYIERFPLYSNLFARLARPSMLLDVHGISTGLPVTVESPLLIFPAENDLEFGENLGLARDRYVTVHDGFDDMVGKEMGIARCTKQLPVEAWQKLIAGIRDLGLQIVQVGSANEPELPGVDIDLRGKTSLSQLAHVLKGAAVHVDTEGGIVHVARAVHKKSIVFFGPTSVSFWGYPQNINLCSEEYADFWWINSDWMARSPIKQKVSAMEAFDVSIVAGLVARELAAIRRRSYLLELSTLFTSFAVELTGLREAGHREPVTRIKSVIGWAETFVLGELTRRFGRRASAESAIVGSCTAGFASALAEITQAVEVIDLDGAPRLEDAVADNPAGVRVSSGSIYNLPANSDKFDIVVSIAAVDLAANANRAVHELFRLLKPGGVALIGYAVSAGDGENSAGPDAIGGKRDAATGDPVSRVLTEACGTVELFSETEIRQSAELVRQAGFAARSGCQAFGVVCVVRRM